MDNLTIRIMTPTGDAVEALMERLSARMEPFLHTAELNSIQYAGYVDITVGNLKPLARSQAKRSELLDAFSAAVAEYIIDRSEKTILERMIGKELEDSGEGDLKSVMTYCKQLMDAAEEPEGERSDNHGRTRRIRLLKADIKDYMKESPLLILEGFLQFRMRQYEDELFEVMEYAMDEYLMDQQYKEFIALLKYFVFIQDAKIPEAHLMHKGGHEFVLLNEQLLPIDTEHLDSSLKVEFLDKDFNLEDLIVSTLITIAPQTIYIHTREPEIPIIKTIMQIFEDRAKLCEYCRICKPLLGDSKPKDQLSP